MSKAFPTASEFKAEKRRLRDEKAAKEMGALRAEEARKEALSMWERIEEADASADVKDILHRLAEKIGLEG